METSEFITIDNAKKTNEWQSAYCVIARETIDGRVVMRKSLREEYLDNGDLRDMLRKEYALGSLLAEHTPYVVGYRRMTDDARECSIVMDYVEGETVDVFISTHPDFFRNESNLRKFLGQLLEGLEEIHNSQVVHMDIKPSNVMLTSINSDVRIIDLGLSYSYSYPSSAGMTDVFAAPEQKASGSVDARTDIYAVGKMIEYIANRLNDNGRTYQLPRAIRQIMEGCLHDEKERRWQSCGDIMRRLNRGGKHLWMWLMAIVLAMAAAVGVYLERGNDTFSDTYGMRYFNVFGRRQDPNGMYAAVIPKFIKQLMNGEVPTINGDGRQSRDFTYIDNVIEANLKACLASSDAAGEAFNIGAGGREYLIDVYHDLCKALGKEVEPNFGPNRAGDIRDSNADISKARELLGYNPEYDFAKGINLAIDWYKENL